MAQMVEKEEALLDAITEEQVSPYMVEDDEHILIMEAVTSRID